jgi:hypothetical protein
MREGGMRRAECWDLGGEESRLVIGRFDSTCRIKSYLALIGQIDGGLALRSSQPGRCLRRCWRLHRASARHIN